MTQVVVSTTLPADVAPSGTLSVSYPAGVSQAGFTGLFASARAMVVVNGNEVYRQADGAIDIAYGLSTAVVTNFSQVAWPLGALVSVQLTGLDQPASAGGGGVSPEGVVAVIAAAVGEGNILMVEDGQIVGVGTEAAVDATVWSLLTAEIDAANQGLAVRRMEEVRVGSVASNVATFDWPSEGSPELSLVVRYEIAANTTFAIAEIPEGIADRNAVLIVTLIFENTSESTRTVDVVAGGEGLHDLEWMGEDAAVDVTAGETVRVQVSVYPEIARAVVEAASA